ncbi:MAG: D-alanyl-D-alanine dipeptidase [Cyanosarcina radialis HA8281-LM2]|jgi:D-alanyl-D-alanine dipeptidase|nr:D-alanyl-D-alanine dipeptidase [Cyanosarcina radialis HA8281-LM2]
MKPYQKIPIVECGEPLVSIPVERFAIASPHPYQKLGAPYGERSPYYLRQSVLNSLLEVQSNLELHRPRWRIQIFDAYRPVSVQEFMVEYTFAELLQTQGLNPDRLTDARRQEIWERVYQFWAPPSLDPATPPPHSTGAAVDITLVDETGQALDMGTAIDEISPASHPDYFANVTSPLERQYRDRRQLLQDIMFAAGFGQHPNEWWHFCLGDQMWAWLSDRDVARYGRVV